jgi:branched-chain amino acid transport system substrate-binding protein
MEKEDIMKHTTRQRKWWKEAITFVGRVLPVAAFALANLTLLFEGTWSPASAAGLDRPLKIGLLADKTGPLAAYGYAHEKVAQAVVKKINKEGGVNGQPIELIVADTESNASVATMKMRQLIESSKVDFVVGSNTSAVVLAVAPTAKELNTVYFPTAGGALLTTPGKGNRYVFDYNTDVKQETQVAARFANQELKIKDWATVVVDYAWGWDQEQSFKEAAKAEGLNVLASVRVPIGTGNWLRYLQGKVPKKAKGVYFANFGTDFLAFIRDLFTIRPDMTKIGGNYVLSGQDVRNLGPASEGLYVLTGYPQLAEEINTEFDRVYRKTIGMDDKGREEGTGKYLVPSYQWATWESIYTIKEVVEETGWKSKADTAKFVNTLESKRFKQSEAHPEGDKYFRAEDHLAIKGLWIEQIKDGKLRVAKRIEAKEVIYTSMVNYPKEEPF